MIRASIVSLAAAVAIVALSGSLSAKPALKDVEYVREGLISVGIAYEISQRCDSIDARIFRGINFLNGLRGHARSLGYSDAEIDAYINDKDEENRLEGVARARLATLGAQEGNEASYCAAGRSEMASGSSIGRLLR